MGVWLNFWPKYMNIQTKVKINKSKTMFLTFEDDTIKAKSAVDVF